MLDGAPIAPKSGVGGLSGIDRKNAVRGDTLHVKFLRSKGFADVIRPAMERKPERRENEGLTITEHLTENKKVLSGLAVGKGKNKSAPY